jgi:hypothetical protein
MEATSAVIVRQVTDRFAYGQEMQFRVLGPVDVVGEGRRLAVGGLKQRTVLAMLIANAGVPVSIDRLIEGTWGARLRTNDATSRGGCSVRSAPFPPPAGVRIVSSPASEASVWGRCHRPLWADDGGGRAQRGRGGAVDRISPYSLTLSVHEAVSATPVDLSCHEIAGAFQCGVGNTRRTYRSKWGMANSTQP